MTRMCGTCRNWVTIVKGQTGLCMVPQLVYSRVSRAVRASYALTEFCATCPDWRGIGRPTVRHTVSSDELIEVLGGGEV